MEFLAAVFLCVGVSRAVLLLRPASGLSSRRGILAPVGDAFFSWGQSPDASLASGILLYNDGANLGLSEGWLLECKGSEIRLCSG